MSYVLQQHRENQSLAKGAWEAECMAQSREALLELDKIYQKTPVRAHAQTLLSVQDTALF